MLFLLLATIASAGNALTIKFAGSRSVNRLALLLFNYLAATMLSALSAVRSGLVVVEVAPWVWLLGLVTGTLFISAIALMQLNVRLNGATVSSSLFRMGAVIPMLLSIALFREYPTMAGAGGILAQDHTKIGGLGAQVARVLAENACGCKFKILGTPDEYVPLATTEFLYHRNELDAEGLAKNVRKLLA